MEIRQFRFRWRRFEDDSFSNWWDSVIKEYQEIKDQLSPIPGVPCRPSYPFSSPINRIVVSAVPSESDATLSTDCPSSSSSGDVKLWEIKDHSPPNRAPNCYVFLLHDPRALSLFLSLPSISTFIPSGDFQSFPSSPLNQYVYPSLYRITVFYRTPPLPLYRSIACLYSIRGILGLITCAALLIVSLLRFPSLYILRAIRIIKDFTTETFPLSQIQQRSKSRASAAEYLKICLESAPIWKYRIQNSLFILHTNLQSIGYCSQSINIRARVRLQYGRSHWIWHGTSSYARQRTWTCRIVIR